MATDKANFSSTRGTEYDGWRRQSVTGFILLSLLIVAPCSIAYALADKYNAVWGLGFFTACSFIIYVILYFFGESFYFSVDGERDVLLRDDVWGVVTRFTQKGFYFKCPWEDYTDVDDAPEEKKVTRDLQSVQETKDTAAMIEPYSTLDDQQVMASFLVQFRNDPELLGTRNVTPIEEVRDGLLLFFREKLAEVIAKYSFKERELAKKEFHKWLEEKINPTNINSEPEEDYGIRIVRARLPNIAGTKKTVDIAATEAEGKAIGNAIIAFVGGPEEWKELSQQQKQEARSQYLAAIRGEYTRVDTRSKGKGGGMGAVGTLATAALAENLDNKR